MQHDGPADETAIRGLIEARARAVRAKDVDSALTFGVPGLVEFDVVGPLRRTGAEGIRRRTVEW
jgi:ketosteroid isomerase-like protein